MILKKLIPAHLKLQVKILLRKYRDLKTGQGRLFAKDKLPLILFKYSIATIQPIIVGSNFENKLHNIARGAAQIDGILLYPQQVFSFWEIIQQPSKTNGYLLSRNIVGGTLREDYGGGLCQLASIIYHQALKTGMAVTERYNHSVDIYKEEDRFTPLGADATVVYGYKDLRFQNSFSEPVRISLNIENNTLTCKFSSPAAIAEKQVEFFKENRDFNTLVVTYINKTLLIRSLYHKPTI